MRREGKLVSKCKKIIRFDDKEMNYEGEIDEHNMACGRGVAAYENNEIVGMFEADQPMGICSYNNGGIVQAGEFKNGELFGKATLYHDDDAFNFIFCCDLEIESFETL